MKRTMTARRLRGLLLVAMLVILVSAVGGFIFVQNQLTGYAQQISKLNADAAAGNQNLTTLKKLKQRLEEDTQLVEKTHSIIGDGAMYTDQVVTSLSEIASRSGATINSIEFNDDATAAAAAPAAGSAAGTAAPTAPTAAMPSGVSIKNVTVSVKSPLSYETFMNFLVGLETSDLRMQVTNIGLTKDDKANVSTQAFTLEVYVRS